MESKTKSKKIKHLWEREPLGVDSEMIELATNVFKSFDHFIEWINEVPCLEEDGNPCVIRNGDHAAFLYWEWVPSIKKAKKNKQEYYLVNYIKCEGKPHDSNCCLDYYKEYDYLIIIMQNLVRSTVEKTVYKITVTEDDEPKVIECFEKMFRYMNNKIYRL